MNDNLTIFINQPMENNSRTERLFNYTYENCYKMYPNATIHSYPEEDSRQKQIWTSIYWAREVLGIVCVISAGHIFLEPNKTFELVKEQVKGKTWWALGHMLDRTKEGTYLRIFNSCYFVNIPEIKSAMKKPTKTQGPYPGYRPNDGVKGPWKNWIRSKQNHHGHYTPLWIENGRGYYEGPPLKEHCGSVMIHEGIKRNIRFESFNQKIRDSKEFAYMNWDDFNSSDWDDMMVYLDTKTIPNRENDDNYWWFYRDSEIKL